MNLGQTLVDQGLITSTQLTQAIDAHNRDGRRLDHILLADGFLDEDSLLKALSELLHLEFIDLSETRPSREAIDALSSRMVYRKRIVPIALDDQTLSIATSDPFDTQTIDEVRVMTGYKVDTLLAPTEAINKVISTYYGVGGDTITQLIGDQTLELLETDEEQDLALAGSSEEASVVKLVNEIFVEAINERASDIHIEPYENDLSVRYRIDGVLAHANVSSQIKHFQAEIISRIKIMAHLNIAEKRLPQDGRIKLRINGKPIDIRVSVIPMLHGEGIVMRVLDQASVLYTLPELGMEHDTHQRFDDQIAKPHGIILVTGPTGSGKTTTLYASLQAIVGETLKVLTVEDPVEYHLDGVNQIQVQPKIGYTFAEGLRAILRHDPDVVMIGEIRDKETAEAAIQASLTGHLVLSTLHTNDSCSAATRLLDMGIEPFLVTSSLSAVMAQRLVRSICPHCKESYTPNYADLPEELGLKKGEKLYRGKGCGKCRGTGYRGRSGLYELLIVNNEIRELVLQRASAEQIIEVAKRTASLRLLREDGWLRVKEGVTTIEEVMRVTKA